MPLQCICGLPFGVDHAMQCKRGGYISHRHNEVRDITAHLLNEVCHDVQIEPQLLPLEGEAFQHLSANTRPDFADCPGRNRQARKYVVSSLCHTRHTLRKK